MLIVYQENTGEIVYTIKNKNDKNFISNKETRPVIVSPDENIKPQIYKVDLETKEIVKKPEEEIKKIKEEKDEAPPLNQRVTELENDIEDIKQMLKEGD